MPNPMLAPLVAHTLYEQYPGHWGAALTVAAVTSRLRECETGLRQSYVDMLSELLEGDPHARGVLTKLFTAISNAEWVLEPADVDEKDSEAAEDVAASVTQTIAAFGDWRKHVASLLWAHFYGVGAREILWRRDAESWGIASLNPVHSRRIAYDASFRPYVVESAYRQTGIYFDEYPGKFLLFEPKATDEYQTREGLGRVLAYWMAFKRFTVRDLLGYSERFGKPFPIARYHTSSDGVPRPADEDDIETAKSIVRDIGRGSQPGAVVPDSIELELVGPGGETSRGASGDNTVHKALIEMCNAEISKAVLGGTLTTEVGDGGGNRALGEVQALQQSDIARSLAAQFDAAVTSQLVRWIVELNFGADMLPLAPRYRTKCEPQEDMAAVADAFAVLVGTGLKVPEAWAYARFGIPAPMDDEPVIGGDVAQVEQEQPGAGEPTPADKDTAQTGEEQD